jgi:hypothetical protein
VSDSGLAELKGLKQIVRIDFAGTHVTEAGIGRLKEQHPGASFTR